MFNLDIILKNIKLVAIILVIVAAVWFYKDFQYQKSENERQSKNNHQRIISDSIHYTNQILSSKELVDYLQYQNSGLKKKLEKDGIKLSRIESIISSKYHYRDTIIKETDISGLVESIKNSIPKSQEWSDSTKCLNIKGIVSFDGQKLKVIVKDRELNNKSDGVAYIERRQWSFLGIKTRFLGKKQITAKVYDDCGETITLKVEKKK